MLKKQDININKSNNMQKTWNTFWKQLEIATNEFNSYIDSGIPSIAQQKIIRFIKEWDKLKEQAMKLDELMQNPIDPIDVKIPFEEEEFLQTWKYWKEYLLESFGKTYKSREEQKVLEHLDEISEGRPDLAVKYLNFAMAKSYPKFFKVADNAYSNPAKETYKDGDF